MTVAIKGIRWWMIGLLMLGAIINYLTRSTLAVAAPTVLKDLAISTQQYSWILGAFQGAIMLQPRSSAWRTAPRTAGRCCSGFVACSGLPKDRQIPPA